jgi:hypothetical protein
VRMVGGYGAGRLTRLEFLRFRPEPLVYWLFCGWFEKSWPRGLRMFFISLRVDCLGFGGWGWGCWWP